MVFVKRIHRASALLLIIFITFHLAVNLTAVFGADVHIAALKWVQMVYRHPVGEVILILAILTQIVTGLQRVRVKPLKGWGLIQVVSGCYLVVFLIAHSSAALYTHHIFGIETNFYWAAGSLHYFPLKYGFALYYLLAVLAVFSHLGAALYFGFGQAVMAKMMPFLGVGVGCTIIAGFSGVLYPIEIPLEVARYYQVFFGVQID